MKRQRRKLELYPHQVEGVNAILHGFQSAYMNRFRNTKKGRAFLLFDEMGLGKTIQALSATKKNLPNATGPTLVVCPASLLNVWMGRDFDDFFADTFFGKIVLSGSTKPPRQPPERTDIFFVSYKQLARLSKKKTVGKWVFEQQWGHLLMDEVHKIKNSSSLACKAVGALKSEFRLALSGTPVMNHGGEMLNLFRYALKFEDLDWYHLRIMPNGKAMQNLLSTFTLGRKKSEIQFGSDPPPPTTEHEVYLDWLGYDEGRHAYREEKRKYFARSFDDLSFLHLVQRLKQICLYPDYSYDNCVTPKMIETLRICREAAPGKVIVACTYKKFLKPILKPWLASKGIKSLLYCGESRKKQRETLYRFHSEPDIQVLLVVKAAGALGLNLQNAASTIVILDPHFNAATDDQAAARVDRIGQTEAVHVYRLFMKGSIDVALLKMQREKKHLTDAWERKKKKKKTVLSWEMAKLHLQEHDTV